MQLAGALQVNDSYLAANEPPIILLSADSELNAAAVAEGMVVEDLNAHP